METKKRYQEPSCKVVRLQKVRLLTGSQKGIMNQSDNYGVGGNPLLN